MAVKSSSGECLCGALRFRAEWPSIWIAHCHCSMCRRAHGAALVTWVSFLSKQVHIDDPDAMLRWHRSSLEAERGFCASCGSSLFFRSSNWSDQIHIARANFVDALDREPQLHAFFDTHVDWLEFNDTLPRKSAAEIMKSP